MEVALVVLVVVALLVIGVPIGFSLIGATMLGLYIYDPIQLPIAATSAINSVNSPTFVAIPLFVIAGAIIAETAFMDPVLDVLSIVLRRLRGGTTLSCIGTALFFAGTTGSSAGESAALATSFYEPMRRRGYEPGFTGAVICSSAAVGILVPPSVTLIIYGTLANYPVQELWLAGIAPAAIAAVLLSIVCVARGRKYEAAAGPDDGPKPTIRELGLRRIIEALGAVALPVLVLVGVYGGYVTISETAAIAIIYLLAYGFLTRRLPPRRIYACLHSGLERASIVVLIFIGAHVFNYYLVLTGTPNKLVNSIVDSGLPRFALILLLLVALLALGSLMDGLGLLIIATPILYPLLGVLHLSPVQLGVMLAMTIEIGVIHPPAGMNLFAVSGVTGIPVGRIALQAIPFIVVLLTVLVLVAFAPLPIFSWA